MDHIISKLLIYGDMPEDSILMQMGDICRSAREHIQSRDELVTRCFRQVKRILEVATDYGFDKNLWHNYLTFLLMTDENPFSLTCEKMGARDGSVNFFAKKRFPGFSGAVSSMISDGWRKSWASTAFPGFLITYPSESRS